MYDAGPILNSDSVHWRESHQHSPRGDPLTILVGLDLQLFALHDALGVAQHQLNAEVGEGRQVVNGVLRVAALRVVAQLLAGLLLAAHPGAVLHRQVVVVAAGHVVAQRLPAHCHLLGLDVHHLEPPRPVHGLWGDETRREEKNSA